MHRRWLWGPLFAAVLLTGCQATANLSSRLPGLAMLQPHTLRVGDLAPDFTLPDQNRQNVTLSQFRGQTVQVAFYVWAFSYG
jgi:hypothetical protein